MTPCEKLGYKVGDKFIVLVKDEAAVGFTQGQTVTLAKDDGSSNPLFRGKNTIRNGEAYLSLHKVKKIEGQSDMNKDFTKDMLRTGMRVVHRNGMVGIVFKDVGVISYGPVAGFNSLKNYEYFEESFCEDEVDYAYLVDKVYAGYQDGYIINFNKLGELIWERKEETEQQRQIRELQDTIKKAQEQIENLQKLS